MQDRRKTQRVVVTEPVIVVWSRGNVVGEVRDISPAGMFIALADAGDVIGMPLAVQISPAHPRDAIEATGIVRWSDHRGIGVEIATGNEVAFAALAKV